MTENEAFKFIGQAVIESGKALEALQSIKSEAERIGKIGEYYANLDNCVKEIEACRVAMIALSEIQSYRAIGTVNEVAEMSNSYINYFHKARQFEAIGTIEEFKALKEKNTPKKPFGGMYDWTCPTCGTYHSTHGKCCSECMQMILWD